MVHVILLNGLVLLTLSPRSGVGVSFQIPLMVVAAALQTVDPVAIRENLAIPEKLLGFARRMAEMPKVGVRRNILLAYFDSASHQQEWGAGDVSFVQGRTLAYLFRSDDGYKCCVVRHDDRELPPFGDANTFAVVPGTAIPTDSSGLLVVVERQAVRDCAREMRRAVRLLTEREQSRAGQLTVAVTVADGGAIPDGSR